MDDTARRPANPVRGEAAINIAGEEHIIRPSFQALIAAEEELGSLFALVERAAAGQLKLSEIAVLIWHCVHHRPPDMQRGDVGEAIGILGMAGVTPILKILLKQILQGQSSFEPTTS